MNELVSDVLADRFQVVFLIEMLTHEKTTIKFGCAKVLRLVSEQNPELLSSENSFLKWGPS